MNQNEFEKQWKRSKEYAEKLIANMVADGLTENEAQLVAEFIGRDLKEIISKMSQKRLFTIPKSVEGDK